MTGCPRELDDMRVTIRAYLRENCTEDVVRRAAEAGEFDRELWGRLSADLGLQAILLGEDDGGLGGGPAELAVVMEALGEVLYAGPFLSSVVAAGGLLALTEDPEVKQGLLPAIGTGKTIAAVCGGPLIRPEREGDPVIVAQERGGVWHLSGTEPLVLGAAEADVLVVLARHPDGSALFVVPVENETVTVSPLESLDLTASAASVELIGARGQLVGGRAVEEILESFVDLVAVAIAAEQVGGAQRVLDLTVSYAATREQFGRPIGSFQSIKHLCVDMLVAVRGARAALAGAVVPGATRADASIARAVASDAYFVTTTESIQVHGGIGFTWEHPCHLYFRRARSRQSLFGTTAFHYDRAVSASGLLSPPRRAVDQPERRTAHVAS